MTDLKPGYTDQGHPFNMAFATLERIHNILVDYAKVSTFAMIECKTAEQLAQALELKRRIAWQIYLQSVFLLDEDQQAPLVKEYEAIGVTTTQGGTRQYSNVEELKIDRFVISLLDYLQKNKLFMPGKNDPRNAFRRE